MLIKGTTSATSSSATLLPKTDIRTASPTTCYKAPKMPMLVLSHASHPRAVLTGAPRWALADIFVSYTRSDRAAANPWIRSGVQTARNAHLRSSPEPPSKRYAHLPRCYLRRGDVSNRHLADIADRRRCQVLSPTYPGDDPHKARPSDSRCELKSAMPRLLQRSGHAGSRRRAAAVSPW